MKSRKKLSNHDFFIFRRNHSLNKGQGYIEYTRNAEDDTTSSNIQPSGNTRNFVKTKNFVKSIFPFSVSADGQPVKRAVARKSTTPANKKPEPDPDRVRWESKVRFFKKFREINFTIFFLFYRVL